MYCLNMLSRCISDPLVHHGRHFGCTVHAMTKVQALLTNGLLRIIELANKPDEDFTAKYVVFLTSLNVDLD